MLEITCAAPVAGEDSGMEVTTTVLTVGAEALYSCSIGRRLVGQSSRHCLKSGLWNGTQPFCECNDFIIDSKYQITSISEITSNRVILEWF